MTTLLQFILTLIIFLSVNYFAYWLTEVKGLPRWLDYPPFSCRTCCTFWLLIGVNTAIFFSFSCLMYTAISGYVIAVLNAIAMYLHQRQNTISIEDYDKIIND